MLNKLLRLNWVARIHARNLLRKYNKPIPPFFHGVRGVIHIGAHFGEEILMYAKGRLKVLWIEANPDCMALLKKNLKGFEHQKVVCALVGEKSIPKREFFISNNNAASSSMLPFEEHKVIWPDVKMVKRMFLHQKTLNQVLVEEGILTGDYDTLVMDVQGAELEILRGIPDVEKQFNKIELEAADFPAYQGCPVREQITDFLKSKGFKEIEAIQFATDGFKRNYYTVRYIYSN